MAKVNQEFASLTLVEKTMIPTEEYRELLITKGKYEELKELKDKIFSILTPNEVKSLLKFDHLIKKKEVDKI